MLLEKPLESPGRHGFSQQICPYFESTGCFRSLERVGYDVGHRKHCKRYQNTISFHRNRSMKIPRFQVLFHSWFHSAWQLYPRPNQDVFPFLLFGEELARLQTRFWDWSGPHSLNQSGFSLALLLHLPRLSRTHNQLEKSISAHRQNHLKAFAPAFQCDLSIYPSEHSLCRDTW